jgi:hypothetical protein
MVTDPFQELQSSVANHDPDTEDSDSPLTLKKTSYQRPKHPRVFCNECDTNKEGYRGEHELRRHKDREHRRTIKKWMCVEPADNIDHPKPIVPLATCNACQRQKKQYGVYYNAAAHLRRVHFNPRRYPSADDPGDPPSLNRRRRIGGAGSDWPPMSELKFWMQEMELTINRREEESEDEDIYYSFSETEDESDNLDRRFNLEKAL